VDCTSVGSLLNPLFFNRFRHHCLSFPVQREQKEKLRPVEKKVIAMLPPCKRLAYKQMSGR
jgi:hypothetical protein